MISSTSLASNIADIALGTAGATLGATVGFASITLVASGFAVLGPSTERSYPVINKIRRIIDYSIVAFGIPALSLFLTHAISSCIAAGSPTFRSAALVSSVAVPLMLRPFYMPSKLTFQTGLLKAFLAWKEFQS